jgi:hypothetical protein
MRELSDTSRDASDFQIALLQSKTTSERLALTFMLSQTTSALSKRAIRRANPDISENELRCRFVELHYGKVLADNFRQYLKENPA